MFKYAYLFKEGPSAAILHLEQIINFGSFYFGTFSIIEITATSIFKLSLYTFHLNCKFRR